MKKTLKKIVALTMTCAMLFTPVFATEVVTTDPDAASGDATGDGTLEGYVDTDVFAVVLPVEATEGKTFAFTLDPQGLLKATSDDADDYTTDTVYFKNVSGEATTYSGTSDELTAINKGTVDVDVSVTATAEGLADSSAGYDIKLADDDSFTGDTSTSLYLGLTMGSGDAIPLDKTSLSATAKQTLY